jgi:hypothetical protein
LLGYPGFQHQGFKIVAAFDANPKKRGKISGVPVYPSAQIAEIVRKLNVSLGILTVPADQAQSVADAMMAGGIRGIWNFTPVQLSVPADVIVKREDLAASLAVLSHRCATGEVEMIVGLDALRARRFDLLRGRRVGLLSHQAALTADGSTSAQLLRRALGRRLVALYGPEHGFFGQALAGEHTYTRAPRLGHPRLSLTASAASPLRRCSRAWT